jgi:hypothetical protein
MLQNTCSKCNLFFFSEYVKKEKLKQEMCMKKADSRAMLAEFCRPTRRYVAEDKTFFFLIFKFWFVRLLALRPFLAYCASLG